MDKLRKYIRKEIQSLHEQKSYPVPLELMDVMKDVLQMRPLKRYINNIKAVNSIPPSSPPPKYSPDANGPVIVRTFE